MYYKKEYYFIVKSLRKKINNKKEEEKIINLIKAKKEYKILKIINKKYGDILNLDCIKSVGYPSTNYFQQHYLEFLF